MWPELQSYINPILTGLFESKFLLRGGQLWPPLQILCFEVADRREILHGTSRHLIKSIATTWLRQIIGLVIMPISDLCK